MRYIVCKSDIIHNLRVINEHCKDSEVICVIKGNGYGCGLIEMAELLTENGVNTLAVSSLYEAVRLRKETDAKDILLLSPPYSHFSAEEICKNNIICTIDSLASAKLLDKTAEETGCKARAHFTVDTGFGRYGFLPGQESLIIEAYRECNNVLFEGVYSHFYNSFSRDPSSVILQSQRFEIITKALEAEGLTGLKRHICSSAAAVKYPEYHFDAVRVGSAILGRVADKNGLDLIKVGRLEGEIISMKELPSGHFVGYGQGYITKRRTVIAVVPIGVRNGFGTEKSDIAFTFKDKVNQMLRKLKRFGQNQVLTGDIDGKKVNVIGKVGLTDMMLDVTDVKDAAIGDKVTFEFNPTLLNDGVKKEYI